MSLFRPTRILFTAALALAAVACGDSAIEVPAPVTTSVRINPGDKSLVVGEQVNYTAVALGQDGAEIPGRVVSWSSSDAQVASISQSGVVIANTPGQATISAAVDGRSATAMVTVTKVDAPPPVDSSKIVRVVISPSGALLEVGQTRLYTAVGVNAAGQIVAGKSTTWIVDNPNAASMDATGNLLAIGAGYLMVTAIVDGVSTSVAATVGTDYPLEYDLLYHRDAANGDGEIFILNQGMGADPFRLNAGTVSRMPTPSPTGLRIAFQVSMFELGTNKRIDDIFAVDRNGMNMKRLTTAEGVDDMPDWSPVGDRIVYRHVDDVTASSSIWIMNADGTNARLLASFPEEQVTVAAPKWSRDGQRIAFSASRVVGAVTVNSIWVMNADGTNLSQLTTTGTGFDQLPSWSPDGKQIAFVRAYSGDWDISILEVATGRVTRLPLAGNQSFPAWSPDGELIAFTQPYPGASRSAVYTMRPNGATVRLRTTKKELGGGTAPTWIARD
jgi:tricorn protease-like protein